MTRPQLPSVVQTGEVLATVNDWRAIMIVMMFIIVALICFIIWREFSLGGLRKAIDKVADALWALKLTMVEERAATAKEQVAAGHERELADAERGFANLERGRTSRERKRVGTRDASRATEYDLAGDERGLAGAERGLAGEERKEAGEERRRVVKRDNDV